MFATFTDWEFENMDGAPDAETAQAAIERMRATALEKMPGKVISTTAGTIMVDLS
ncbi:hypothetical protein N9P09_02215 [Amylibacter sp.]|nr:hypothetical protein [Amylibacter sp.]